ncbi:similar to Saccharomyces cerevisiae YNL110C NOP15 Constituent of 66S pre-ribosomal particles, involved in 60S ribosomal subunit biogenesis [Maudiozyma barnettii]|uniref:Similar to Saccharomyces cerevisiae YNL110C NOP15 Constituent of 66S pre-ribosomal particles, involved in 60S ribosomal subunit biogenesis n=1 Tax=Maudiozyma barnettii TaxID=61262 RepID=A0A8H2VC09_9SACH|nr:rRNA-binding ribosome biosynthesis protein NOP15 [Kazachstania barnettii]CAB4252502.1 similar to Saccharomyces cerevisiae YNL110C NOP15 Constituent of 66S pre-ribosomal particles, involved in 60S ribosomal subunit biogenesis [Kazachstania barnettii]CAD1779236.1 similar to Saccharomyces cerevisiae YNL110C NOP15 Constituent of 66S pre-ribosomal particles, involved in 60S ribosomal subunit biogenesis [Kazachstania barnettii]
MATTRSSTKNAQKPAAKDVAEPVQKINDNIEVESSESESDEVSADELNSDIEGLSESDNEEGSKHNIKKLKSKKNQDDGESKKGKNDQYSSIIYVSRLPHGFHERELSKYFSQFGDLKEVRLARNKKSGNSRHYGFIEFANKDDAKIAQEAMNNYLLMGHLLQVRLLGNGAKIEKLFKYRKRAYAEADIKKSAKELQEGAVAKQQARMEKLAEAGIKFSW